jgi:hypothetical protein
MLVEQAQHHDASHALQQRREERSNALAPPMGAITWHARPQRSDWSHTRGAPRRVKTPDCRLMIGLNATLASICRKPSCPITSSACSRLVTGACKP